MQNDQGPPAPTPNNGTSLNVQPPEFGPDYSNNLQGYKVYKKSPDNTKKIVLILSIVLSAMLVISAGLYFWIHASTNNTPPATTNNTPTPSATGTDDASLKQNLDDLTKNISQGDKDQANIDSSVNDKKSQVEVPTN
ncbi:MAG TPA: hypothetical protein VLI54_07005 [Bacillota bacterium]|nr:hypothetical protein [Bacillota bacterium]